MMKRRGQLVHWGVIIICHIIHCFTAPCPQLRPRMKISPTDDDDGGGIHCHQRNGGGTLGDALPASSSQRGSAATLSVQLMKTRL